MNKEPEMKKQTRTKKVSQACKNARAARLKSRKGVGPGTKKSADELDFKLDRIIIYDSVPPCYELHIENKILRLTTAELLTPSKFRLIFTDHLHRVIRMPRKGEKRWEDHVDEMLARAEIVHQPDEASDRNFWNQTVKSVIDNLPSGDNREELEHGASVVIDGKKAFTLKTVLNIVQKTIEAIAPNTLAVILHELNCVPDKRFIDGKQVRIWLMPIKKAMDETAKNEQKTPENLDTGVTGTGVANYA